MKHKALLNLVRNKQISDAKKRLERVEGLYDVEKIYDLNYLNDGKEEHDLDVYMPHGSQNRKTPVILEIHGGGFCTGLKLINEPHGQWYASKGYKVVNVNYTLLPEATIFEEMQELFASLHWIEDNADRYGFDLDKLFLSGDSAGGFHVLLMAAIQNSEELQKYYHITPVEKGIKGVAATCPCADYRKISKSKEMIWRLIVPLAFQDPRYKDEGFIHHISAPDTFRMSDYPKVFISTSKDDTLLYNDSRHVHELLDDLGIDHVYKEYVGHDHKLEHVWNVLYPDWEESLAANNDFLAYFEEMCQQPDPRQDHKEKPIPIWGERILGNSERSKFDDMNINFRKKQLIPAMANFLFSGIRGDEYEDHSESIDTWTYLAEIKPGHGRETYEDVPHITPFLVPGSKRAVLIVPGGGFSYKQSDFDGEGKQLEGDLVAKVLNDNGISAFVLWYRTNPYPFPIPLLDIQRAVRYIKYHANEFGVDPDKISAIGFSAGGYEIAGLMNLLHGKNRFPEDYAPDAVDAVSDKLETAALIYPALSFEGLMPMMWACFRREQLETEDQRKKLCEEYNITEHFCSAEIPQFLAYGSKDFMIPSAQPEKYIAKMKGTNPAHFIMDHPSSMHGMGMGAHSQMLFGRRHFMHKYLAWYNKTTA